jgi:AraC family transcriptional regulator
MLRDELFRPAGGRLFAESAAVMIAGLLVRGQAGLGPDRPGGLPAWRLKRLRDHIETHLDGDLGLADLAGLVGLSPDRFAHGFKASTGLSPHRYVIERRVQRAAELLATTSEPIAAIALAVGCSSQAHLTTLFRQVLGTTPGAYRRGL